MALQYNADEIFQIAEQIERNGSRYYRMAATGTSDTRVKEILTGLATMEDRHERTFADLRKELSSREREDIAYDPQGETEAYLRALAEGCVFDIDADPAEQLTGEETPEQIFVKAIELEKDSIVFYMGVKDMVSAELGKKKVDSIIQEEMNHIAMLSEHLHHIRNPK